MRVDGSIGCLIACVGAQTVDYSQYVNPFIGSEGAIPGYACEYSHELF
jgi:hypothetical protein